MTEAAFFLCAGFGTRFRPQTNHLPKPAIPIFNLPQAVYSASLLKKIGVEDFYYNSHHLPDQLDKALEPFFKKKSIHEKEILDSAGGIANAENNLKIYENFCVCNGDTYLKDVDESVLLEAFDHHIKTNSLATLVGINKYDLSLNGLVVDKDLRFTGTSKDHDSLHFTGIYIFNKEIFNLIKPICSHIFKDVLLKTKLKVTVFNAKNRIKWFETGNETDFVKNCFNESIEIQKLEEGSNVIKTYKTWGLDYRTDLNHFLKNRVWGGKNSYKTDSDFLILDENYNGSVEHLKNSVVVGLENVPNLNYFKNKVLVHPSQWT